MTLFMKIFNKLFFSQSNHIVRLAKTQTIQTEDMLSLPAELGPQIDHLGKQINWNQKPIWILFSLIKVYKNWTYPGYSILIVAFVASLISPNLVYIFLKRLEALNPQGSFVESLNSQTLLTWLIGLGLAFCGVVVGLCMQHYFVSMLAGYQRIGSDLNSAIFQKSLRLSLQARAKFQVGDVVNHMSSDSEAASDVGIIVGDLTWALFMIAGTVTMLFFYIGPAALTAVFVMMILAPLTRFVAKRFVKFEEEMMGFRDQRITLMSQVLNSIRIIKSFCWEKSIAQEVTVVRNKELHARKKLATAEVLSSLSYLAVGTIVLFAALLTYHLVGNQLTAPIIFTCISLFTLLEAPFGELSRYFSRLMQALVSIARIQT
jgi:ABC-type multidrug transport system fused ATPase/permease subunit